MENRTPIQNEGLTEPVTTSRLQTQNHNFQSYIHRFCPVLKEIDQWPK